MGGKGRLRRWWRDVKIRVLDEIKSLTKRGGRFKQRRRSRFQL